MKEGRTKADGVESTKKKGRGEGGVNISTRIPLRQGICSGKLGTSIKMGSYPATSELEYVRRALEPVTFNWRSWWQLARKLISFKLDGTRARHRRPSILEIR